MQNQYPSSFHTQFNPWNTPLIYPHTEFASFQHYLSHHLLASLQFKFQALSAEFQKTREDLLEMQQELAEVRQLQKKSEKVCTFILFKQKGGQARKQFTKHLACPFAQCKNKYSSRIALRAHIRRTHKPTNDY